MIQAQKDSGQKLPYDEFFTPRYAVEPILKYLRSSLDEGLNREKVVWEPCDTDGKSQITVVLREAGFKVISTDYRQLDFINQAPKFEFDFIVTNPPYSLKDEFIKRCYFLNKPWAMLLPITALEGSFRGDLYRQHGLQLLVLDSRIQFQSNKSGVWFNTSWFCHRLLPRDLIFEKVYTANR